MTPSDQDENQRPAGYEPYGLSMDKTVVDRL